MKLLLILSIALVLRLISINQSFWLDEATSITVARDFSFNEIITQFSPGDFHPPFYYLMLKAWVGVFGVSEISARMLSVIFALGTIALVYKICKIFNKHAAFYASLLLATAPLHIYYSQEARMYAPVTFFVALSVFLFLKKRWLAFSISLPFVAATDYIALLILPAFWIFALIHRKKFAWKQFLPAHLPLFFAATLWSSVFLAQITSGVSVIGTSWGSILGVSSVKAIALVFVKFMIGRISFDNNIAYGAIILSFALILAIPFWRSIKGFKVTKLFWLWLFVPIVGALVISLKVPVFYYFRFLFCLPAFYILIALGLANIKLRHLVFTIILLFNTVFSGTYLFHDIFHRENWKELTNFITQNSNGRATTLFVANSQMEAYRYYAPDHAISWGEEGAAAGYDTVWLMRYVADVFDPADQVRQKVEKLGYKKVNEYNFNGIVVYRYESRN